jgi:N utilization substance protein B
MSKFFKARHKARYYALQALYGWFISGNALSDIESYFLQEKNVAKFDLSYFQGLLYQVPLYAEELDALITQYLQRPLAEVDPIELTILRIATYEFKFNIDVPYRVIINEALLLTKTFGAVDSYKFINGILDKLAKKLRSEECNNLPDL